MILPTDDIRDILKQRCKPETEYFLSRRDCWFYTFKALICVTFRRLSITYEGDKITVATTHSSKYLHPDFGTVYDYEFLCVGYGIFTGWCVFSYFDSSA